MSDSDTSTQAMLTQLEKRLEAAEKAVPQEIETLMHGFDREVEALCRRVLELPKDQGRAFAGPLEAIYRRLDALPQNGGVAGPRTGAKQASRAYSRMSGPPSGDE